MDNGMWALGLIAIPFICLIIAICLILNHRKNKKNTTVKKNSKFTIILIIILLLPMLNVVLTWTSNISQKMSYANVEELDYYVEQISNYEFNIYFFDEDNNYYRVKRQEYNENLESDIYLLKSGKEKISGLKINLLNERTTKVYMNDYKGNKILVWDVSNY